MIDDYFQLTRSDFFQSEYLPGRAIPDYEMYPVMLVLHDYEFDCKFVCDPNSTHPWITVIYQSMYFAEKASRALQARGLNVYYPKTRYKEREVMADWETRRKRKVATTVSEFTPAYGRYLFIQLINDPKLYEDINITEKMLAGRFNENGVVGIMSVDGIYSFTSNAEIIQNKEFHKEQITKTDPKTQLRFRLGETVRACRGNLHGKFVKVCVDVYMYYKASSKIEVSIGNSVGRHYARVGDLEKC